MTENPKLGDIMFSGDRSRNLVAGKMVDKKDRKISVSDHMSNNSDSFVVDMDRFSNLIGKDINNSNSRITLQRNVSRKGSTRNGDLKFHGNDRETVTTSPKGDGATPSSTPEKPVVAATLPQIAIASGGSAGGGAAATATESRSVGRRFSFRRTHLARISDPKRVLVFFATLSSIGTILLIYFTLSTAKFEGDRNASI